MPAKTRLAKRLVEPDFWTCPHGFRGRPEQVMTFGPEVAELCAAADFAPDPQQQLGLDLIFAVRPDGSPASFSVCVICCRQNLKTGLFKQAALGFIYVSQAPAVMWSAHEMSTTNEAQRDLDQLITDHSFLSRELAPGANHGIYYGNSDQRIEFRTTQQIMFKARTATGGRGLGKEKLILDEAFALTPTMMGAILPVMTAQPYAQVLYGSSAGKADSDVLFDIRERGRNAMTDRMSYLEWLSEREACADPECKHPKDALKRDIDCALDREHLLRKANPSMVNTDRITLERLRDLRQEMPPAEYMRECLGWWDDPAHQRVISTDVWNKLAVEAEDVPEGEPNGFSVDMSPERDVSVAVCVREGDRYHVEIAAEDVVDDTLGVVEWLVARAGRRTPVVIDPYSPAGSLIPSLQARKVKVVAAGPSVHVKACGAFYDDAKNGRLSHFDQPQLNTALLGATKRSVGKSGGWAWGRQAFDVNISPLVAATLARYAASLKKPSTGRQSRGVVS